MGDQARFRLLSIGEGFPDVAGTAFVAPTATLAGRVTVGAEASIWYGAVLRADHSRITVGERSNIQDLCLLHADEDHAVEIGARVTVGHGAVLHGCVVRDDAVVGMGAIVLDGAEIEEGALVAAGTVVRPAFRVPAGQMVAGVPGTLRGTVPSQHSESTGRAVGAYCVLAGDYRTAERKLESNDEYGETVSGSSNA